MRPWRPVRIGRRIQRVPRGVASILTNKRRHIDIGFITPNSIVAGVIFRGYIMYFWLLEGPAASRIWVANFGDKSSIIRTGADRGASPRSWYPLVGHPALHVYLQDAQHIVSKPLGENTTSHYVMIPGTVWKRGIVEP